MAGAVLLFGAAYGAGSKDEEIARLEKRIKTLEERVIKLEGLIAPMSKQYSTQEKAREIEELYEDASRRRNTEEGKKCLVELVKRFPGHNLAGCCLLDLAEVNNGKQKEDYLLRAIKDYSHCRYKNGVIVGALARFLLGSYYIEEGQLSEARALFKKIEARYPNSTTHNGQLLTKIIEDKYGPVKKGKKSSMGMRTTVNLAPPYPDPLRGEGSDKISVQDAIVKLLNQAGLKYDWKKSYKNTAPLCSRVITPEIRNLRLKDALVLILRPLGLTYEIHGDTLVLKKN